MDWHAQNCANKIPYVSKQEARHNAERVRRNSGVQCHIYSCAVCGYFHTTSLTRAASRRARKAVLKELGRR